MIPWGWLIPALLVGASMGAFVVALFAARGQDERCHRCCYAVLLAGYTLQIKQQEQVQP